MLPTHTVFRNVISWLSFSVCFISCGDKSKTELKIIEALNESIENSNMAVHTSSTDLIYSLEDKLSDPSSAEKAKVWFPIAQTVQKVSKDAYNQIQEIKARYTHYQYADFEKQDILKVYECILKYKHELLQIDSTLTRGYQSHLKIFTKRIDSLKENQKESLKNHFSDASVSGGIALLTKLQNNIKVNEQGMIAFCREYSTPSCGMGMIMNAAMVAQSSTIVQAGEHIEISAGLASISADQKPEIFVYDSPIELSVTGLAIYKLKAPSKPGKYYVPVKIRYTDQNGRKQTIKKEVEYTVANIQHQ